MISVEEWSERAQTKFCSQKLRHVYSIFNVLKYVLTTLPLVLGIGKLPQTIQWEIFPGYNFKYDVVEMAHFKNDQCFKIRNIVYLVNIQLRLI